MSRRRWRRAARGMLSAGLHAAGASALVIIAALWIVVPEARQERPARAVPSQAPAEARPAQPRPEHPVPAPLRGHAPPARDILANASPPQPVPAALRIAAPQATAAPPDAGDDAAEITAPNLDPAGPALALPLASISDPPRAVALALRRDGAAVTLSVTMTRRTDLRVFTLDAPRRAVLDLAGLTWALEAPIAPDAEPVSGLRIAQHPDGWGRVELVLDAPMRVAHLVYAPVPADQPDAPARLSLRLVPSSPEAFAAAVGPPLGPAPDAGTDPGPRQMDAPPPRPDRRLPLVVIDPGHGGFDPGAVRGRLMEKEIALRAARILAARLEATGRLRTRLTRDADVFLPLDARIGMAQMLQADLFVSVHANTEPTGTAWGVSVFTLSDAASDAAAARLARLENSADLMPQPLRVVAGTEAPDASADLAAPRSPEVARILADLARDETNAASRRLAETVVRVLARSNRTLSGNPHRAAGFRVLRSAEIPSMLVELGFLTNAEDRARLASDAWLESVSGELVAAILDWHAAEPPLLDMARR